MPRNAPERHPPHMAEHIAGSTHLPPLARPLAFAPDGAQDATGWRLHPNVETYLDGGIGGLPGTRSVVGMVEPTRLIAYRDHDATGNAHSRLVVADLREALRDGTGFTTPLMLLYDPTQRWAYLGEGNHRLAAALDERLPAVPVRVSRCSGIASRRRHGIGAAAHHDTSRGFGNSITPDYCPSDLHPHYLLTP